MKVLVTGISGQLGYCLSQTVPAGIEIVGVGHTELDLADTSSIQRAWERIQPEAVINAAAYTAVDRAESEQDSAFATNATGPACLAELAAKSGSIMIQVSTDFVFPGNHAATLKPGDKTAPINVYGASKLEGERCVQAYAGHKVVRTGWVYGEHGQNFVKTMLRLARQKPELGVVADQVGTPTYARHLAEMLWQLLLKAPEQQIFHFSDAGVASWYDFAEAIFEECVGIGLLGTAPRVKPLTTADYPTPAKRPAYSVLDKTQTWSDLDITPVHWRKALKAMLVRLSALNH